MFDVIIKNARVLDGSGKADFSADIAISGGVIVAVGDIGSDASRVIDAEGLVAAPGFIDIHSHTDLGLFIDPRAQSKITQGITTEICGNCGFSAAPCLDESVRSELDSWRRRHGIKNNWQTLAEMLSALECREIGVNYATLVGHSNLRAATVGLNAREASADEIDEMKTLAANAMQDGAFGISTGLIYPPSSYANTSELVELASVIAAYGGLYVTHIRDEHDGLIGAVEEAIQIGRQSGAGVQISHHKACGQTNWGKVNETLAMVQAARVGGMDITVDHYPYTAGSMSLSFLIPGWAHDGGNEALMDRLKNMRPTLLEHLKIIADEGGWLANDGGWKSVVISSVKTGRNRRLEGRNVEDIARGRGVAPAEFVLDILQEEQLSVGIVLFAQCEEDVETVMRHEASMFGTDSSTRSAYGELSAGKPHPRAFGAFPRILGRYVRERGVITLAAAVKKMTSMPARKLGITDRGLLREGFAADVVVFDPATIIDTATYENPHQLCKGIQYVFVNGRLGVENGELTDTRAGKVLRHNKGVG